MSADMRIQGTVRTKRQKVSRLLNDSVFSQLELLNSSKPSQLDHTGSLRSACCLIQVVALLYSRDIQHYTTEEFVK